MEGIPEGVPEGHQGLERPGQALSSKAVSRGGLEGASPAQGPTAGAPSSASQLPSLPCQPLRQGPHWLPPLGRTAGRRVQEGVGEWGVGMGVGPGGGVVGAPAVYEGRATQVPAAQQRPWALERQLSTSSDVHSSRQVLAPHLQALDSKGRVHCCTSCMIGRCFPGLSCCIMFSYLETCAIHVQPVCTLCAPCIAHEVSCGGWLILVGAPSVVAPSGGRGR